MNLSTYLGNAVTSVWKDILGIPIRTLLGKWDSPKSPQGYYRAVADLDFQISGGGGGDGRSQMQFFAALRTSVWTKYKGAPSPGSATNWERKRFSGKR